MTEIKSCPFCGADAVLKGGPYAQESYSIWCKNLHHMDGGFNSEKLIAEWNGRAGITRIELERALQRVDPLSHNNFYDILDELCECLGCVSQNQEPGTQVPEWVFDGYSVYTHLSDRAARRTSPENVSDVLDAIKAMLKKQR